MTEALDPGRCNDPMPDAVRVRLKDSQYTDQFGDRWKWDNFRALCDLPAGHATRTPHAWRRAQQPPVEWLDGQLLRTSRVWRGDGRPERDNGPYADSAQALEQFDAATIGIPVQDGAELDALHGLVITEAAIISGVELSEFERDVIGRLGSRLDSSDAQVLTGVILRAYLNGRNAGAADAAPVDLDDDPALWTGAQMRPVLDPDYADEVERQDERGGR